MKDVNKTDVNRDNSSKRMRRRKRKMNLYGLVVFLLVAVAGVTVSYTFLFNIDKIVVMGKSDDYTAEQIVSASGIQKGDNLLRLNVHASEQRILDELLYIETAKVDRDFPSSLEITVSQCVPAFNVQYGEGTLLVSKQGKILADNGFITQGLPIFYGYEPEDTVPGKALSSADEQKQAAFEEFISRINGDENGSILSVDMTDKYNMVINYSCGIIFKLGNWTDIEYKMNMAENVMQKDDIKGKTGYITMIGSNQCSFRGSDAPAAVIGGNNSSVPESTTDASESASENSAGTARRESNDEEEEMFRQHNEALEQNTTSGEPEN